MFGASREIRHRLQKLENHLQNRSFFVAETYTIADIALYAYTHVAEEQQRNHLQNESPLLVDAVKGFKELDRIAYRLGLLDSDHSYSTQIPWWPLVSVLGTYSAGKSTFMNSYIDYPLQDTGNQAVDDKFTVISYSNGEESRTLPGIALDADPRFPFYQMADELENVAPGDGARVNAYLQLKTCPSYIIDLSDLVLVFFDARHPESGTMPDTLEHLVANTVSRKDANKFLYILNQMDSTARDDNPEDVVAAWQKALSTEGLTAGKFYTIYDESSAESTDGSQACRPWPAPSKPGQTWTKLSIVLSRYMLIVYIGSLVTWIRWRETLSNLRYRSCVN